MEKSLAQPMPERDAEREQGCTGRTDKMTGMVKKIDVQGFGIIDGADGSKVPFISSGVMNHRVLEPGQKVIFSVRRVKGSGVCRERHGGGRTTQLVWRHVTNSFGDRKVLAHDSWALYSLFFHPQFKSFKLLLGHSLQRHRCGQIQSGNVFHFAAVCYLAT